jgi:ribosome-associated protein
MTHQNAKHEGNRSLVIPAGELRERFSRSSRPGGQGVNTMDSRVELSFAVAGSPSILDRPRPESGWRIAVDGRRTTASATPPDQAHPGGPGAPAR